MVFITIMITLSGLKSASLKSHPSPFAKRSFEAEIVPLLSFAMKRERYPHFYWCF